MQTYKELRDKTWLYQKYIVECLSCPAIAKIVGCCSKSVSVALQKHGIPIRDNILARRLVPLQSFRYKELNNKEWLHQKYEIEGLATDAIAQIIGAKSCNSVRQALIRMNIPVRGFREAQIHDRTSDGFVFNEYTKQVIEGGLLGDAMLSTSNKKSDITGPVFSRKNKFLDHIEYVCDELQVSHDIIQQESRTLRGKTHFNYSMRTLSYDCLRQMYDNWYPKENGRKKLVPCDFKLTPVSLLHWFLDDGSTSYRNRAEYKPTWIKHKEQIALSFSSESFSKEHNEFLAKQICDFGIRARVASTNSGTGWRVKVMQAEVDNFFKFIGPCPVPSLAYKWKSTVKTS